MNLRILLNICNCRNKESIWRRGVCKILCEILTPIYVILMFIGIILVCALLSPILIGAIIAIIQIVCYVSIIFGLDFDGKINIFVNNQKSNPFIVGIYTNIDYNSYSWEELYTSVFGLIGAYIIIGLSIVTVLYVVCVFIRDLIKHRKNIYEQHSFAYMSVMLIIIFIMAFIPLLLDIVAGLIYAIVIFVNQTPFIILNNFTTRSNYLFDVNFDLLALSDDYGYYGLIFSMSTFVGYISIPVILFFSIYQLIKYCIMSCKKDIEESYHDIEMGKIYVQKEEL